LNNEQSIPGGPNANNVLNTAVASLPSPAVTPALESHRQ
jgi:hypothetical protein